MRVAHRNYCTNFGGFNFRGFNFCGCYLLTKISPQQKLLLLQYISKVLMYLSVGFVHVCMYGCSCTPPLSPLLHYSSASSFIADQDGEEGVLGLLETRVCHLYSIV